MDCQVSPGSKQLLRPPTLGWLVQTIQQQAIYNLNLELIVSSSCGFCEYVRADLGGHLKYSQRWSGIRAGVLLGAQGAVRRGESRGGL